MLPLLTNNDIMYSERFWGENMDEIGVHRAIARKLGYTVYAADGTWHLRDPQGKTVRYDSA